MASYRKAAVALLEHWGLVKGPPSADHERAIVGVARMIQALDEISSATCPYETDNIKATVGNGIKAVVGQEAIYSWWRSEDYDVVRDGFYR